MSVQTVTHLFKLLQFVQKLTLWLFIVTYEIMRQ